MSTRRVFERMTIATMSMLALVLAGASGCSKGGSGGAQEAPTVTPVAPSGDAAATPVAAADAGSDGTVVPAADAGAPSEEPGGDVGPLSDCDTSKVRCRRMAPQCAEGEAPTVAGSCFGPCVKIERCACSETVKCPNADKHTCWSNKHCGPYVR